MTTLVPSARPLTTLLATTLFAAALAGCGATARSPVLGRTLALQDDAGVVTVAWDTQNARVYRDGRQVASYEADTFDAALWSVDLPAYGTPRAPHSYDRLLTETEITALARCDWPATEAMVECGLHADCDCGVASARSSLMAAMGLAAR